MMDRQAHAGDYYCYEPGNIEKSPESESDKATAGAGVSIRLDFDTLFRGPRLTNTGGCDRANPLIHLPFTLHVTLEAGHALLVSHRDRTRALPRTRAWSRSLVVKTIVKASQKDSRRAPAPAVMGHLARQRPTWAPDRVYWLPSLSSSRLQTGQIPNRQPAYQEAQRPTPAAQLSARAGANAPRGAPGWTWSEAGKPKPRETRRAYWKQAQKM